jgi:hypothetical protein
VRKRRHRNKEKEKKKEVENFCERSKERDRGTKIYKNWDVQNVTEMLAEKLTLRQLAKSTKTDKTFCDKSR